MAAVLLAALLVVPASSAADPWESLDQKIGSDVFHVNVAIRIKIGDKEFAQLVDTSPRRHYPVFATTPDDKGFRVVGYGSCFPVRATKDGGTYFLTNKHVVDFGDGMIEECLRFFAAMRLHAERTAAFSNPTDRYKQLLSIVNRGATADKITGEHAVFEAMVDSIWETYDNHLSIKADPTRQMFNKYASMVGLQASTGFFIHAAGPSNKPPVVAQLYKKSRNDVEPDLAVIYARGAKLPGLELDFTPPKVGQVVQAIGYPVVKQSGVVVPPVYEPTFTAGRVKEVMPQLIRFQAPVSKGDSGGPLINDKGRVLGVVVRRAIATEDTTKKGGASKAEEYAAAVSAAAVRAFAPDLFGKH